MSHGRIIIVTGEVDSGKTSWCRRRVNGTRAAGVLLLKVYRDGGRVGYDALHLPGSESVPFARIDGYQPSGWVESQRVGPFSVCAEGLAAANAWLHEAAGAAADIMVDEVGPLELAGKGLSSGVRAVLSAVRERRVYLVVRSGCVEAVRRVFGITAFEIVDVGEVADESEARQS